LNRIALLSLLAAGATASFAGGGARTGAAGDGTLFEERFDEKLGEGWSWAREDRASWSVDGGVLRLAPLRGSFWGADNTARSLLLRAVPEAADAFAVEVTVADAPGDDAREPGLYEQAGLLWYVDDDNYVKLVREWYDGKWMIVLAAERAGRAEYAEAAAPAGAVRLRLVVSGDTAVGQFRGTRDGDGGDDEWQAAGEFKLPALPDRDEARPRVGLNAHTAGGDAAEGRRAGFDDFTILRVGETPPHTPSSGGPPRTGRTEGGPRRTP
jgi:regulation of enolase protein 1 (concanavalin A-like superfamily)